MSKLPAAPARTPSHPDWNQRWLASLPGSGLEICWANQLLRGLGTQVSSSQIITFLKPSLFHRLALASEEKIEFRRHTPRWKRQENPCHISIRHHVHLCLSKMTSSVFIQISHHWFHWKFTRNIYNLVVKSNFPLNSIETSWNTKIDPAPPGLTTGFRPPTWHAPNGPLLPCSAWVIVF